MPRVLFVTTRIGFGHQQAAKNLSDAVKQIIPLCRTKTVSYFDFFPKGFESVLRILYIWGLRLFPVFFAYIYLEQKRYDGRGVWFWARILGPRYAKIIKKYNPDLIVITQGLACQWMGWLKRKGFIKVPIFAVITDFVVHPFWVAKEIDRYIVAVGKMKDELIERGVSGDKIEVLGIPVSMSFSSQVDREKIKIKLKINEKSNVILVMGGGWGIGAIDKVVGKLDSLNYPIHILVLTGSNKRLYKKFAGKKFKVPVSFFGRISNVNEFMAVSDLIITKAGGLTIAEVLALGLPAVLWDVIPGQEEVNSDYLIDSGTAVRARNINELPVIVGRLLKHSDRLKDMAKNAKALGKPNAAIDTAELISKYLK